MHQNAFDCQALPELNSQLTAFPGPELI